MSLRWNNDVATMKINNANTEKEHSANPPKLKMRKISALSSGHSTGMNGTAPARVLRSQERAQEMVTSTSTHGHSLDKELNCVSSPSPSDLMDFRGLEKIEKDFLPMLKEVCSCYPSLIESQKVRSPEFTGWAFTALGKVLHFLKTKKVKDMTKSVCEALQNLWDELKTFGFDLIWLEPHVKRALDMNKFVERASEIKTQREKVKDLETELRLAEAKFVAARNDLKKAEQGFDGRSMDSELGYEVDYSRRSPLPRRKHKTISSGKSRMKNKEAHWSKSEMKKKDRGGTSSAQRFEEKDFWGGEAFKLENPAEAFKLENPSAVLVSMQPSTIKYKTLFLPAEFIMLLKPFIENSGEVLVQVSNGRVKTWLVRLTFDSHGKNQNRCRLHGSNWSKFMQDNKLEEGDQCALTVIKDVRVLIEVVIFHKKKTVTHRLSPDIFDNEDHENDEEGDDESEDEEATEDEEEGDDESEDEEETEDEEEEEDDNSSETLNCFPPGSRTVSLRLHKRKRNWTSSVAKSQCNIGSAGTGSKKRGRIMDDENLDYESAEKEGVVPLQKCLKNESHELEQ